MATESQSYRIAEFLPSNEQQVVRLITDVLRDQKVIPDDGTLVDDPDLSKIPEIYSGRGRFWVAQEGDRIIGTVAVREVHETQAKLNRMFVLTEYHGTGVGQALLNQALSFAKAQGFQEVILDTHLLMHRAHRFYEKNGFQRTGSESEKYNYRLLL